MKIFGIELRVPNFDFNERAFELFAESLSDLAKEALDTASGENPIVGEVLPTAGLDASGNRLIKLSTAVEELHLFFAYAMHRAFAAEVYRRQQAIAEALERVATKKGLQTLAKSALSKALGAVLNAVWQIAQTADRITAAKAVAKLVRFHGRASRLSLLDLQLFGNGKRSREIVSTRNPAGYPPYSRDARSTYGKKRKLGVSVYPRPTRKKF